MEIWQESFRSSLKSSKELASYIGHKVPDTNYKVMVPRSFANIIKNSVPLQKQFFPSGLEETIHGGLEDPIADHLHSNVDRLVHRYKNRALFFPTEVCPIICRYCFRKNELGNQDNLFTNNNQLEIEKYLHDHSEIDEIIFTGGDPLVLSDSKLKHWLDFFKSISSIKIIRFHTRTPVIIPHRVDNDFCNLIESYTRHFDQIIFVIHSNHTDEWSEGFDEACKKLNKLPITLLSQSVLLKEVNDNALLLKDLFYGLSKRGIHPYYLHHPDPVKGAMHFTISLEKGYSIYSELKKIVSGWALPKYVLETPNGGGKVSVEKALHDIDKLTPIS